MRYYLITFSITNTNEFGDISFRYEGFPPKSVIEQNISEQKEKDVKLIIQNVFEFKNEDDFNEFRS